MPALHIRLVSRRALVSLSFAVPAMQAVMQRDQRLFVVPTVYPLVRSDSRLWRGRLETGACDASTNVSHSAGGNFATRVGGFAVIQAAENIGADI